MSSGFVPAGKTPENDNFNKGILLFLWNSHIFDVELIDRRPLYERLREAREKVQQEKDESDKLGWLLCVTLKMSFSKYFICCNRGWQWILWRIE